MKLSFVILASPQVAIPPIQRLLEDPRVQVKALVTPPDSPQGRGRKLAPCPVAAFAQDAGIPLLQPVKASSPESLGSLRELAPDLILTIAYGQILTQAFLDIPRLGTLNIHPSLLPHYRGATPVQEALLDGRTQTGVTVLWTVLAMDAGPILAQEEAPVLSSDTAETLMPRLFIQGGALLCRHLDALAQGTAPRIPQDASQVSFCRKISKADAEVDWHRTPEEILRRFRAYQPWPGCFTFYEGKRLLLEGMTLCEESHRPLGPGEWIRQLHDGAIHAGAHKGGCLRLSQGRPEGKKSMELRFFAQGVSGGTFSHGVEQRS